MLPCTASSIWFHHHRGALSRSNLASYKSVAKANRLTDDHAAKMLSVTKQPQPGEALAETFIERSLGRPIYVEQRALQLTEIEATDATDQFCKALSIFHASHKKDFGLRNDFDIRENHSWESLLATVRVAEETYEKRASGYSGFYRKVSRALGGRQKALLPWVDLIPSDNYLSVLSGGLKLLLSAAAYRSNEVNSILVVFEDIGSWRERMRGWTEIFPNDPVVRHHSLRAYVAMLTMIQAQLLRLVGEKTIKTAWNAIKKDKPRGDAINDARRLFDREVKDLETRVQQLHVRKGESSDEYVRQQLSAIAKCVHDMPDTAANKFLNSLRLFFTDQALCKPWPTEPRIDVVESIDDRIRANILGFLGVENSQTRRDLYEARQLARTTPTPSMEQFQWLSSHPGFRSVLFSPQSEVVHIARESTDFATTRHSPMSLISLALIESVQEHQQAHVMYVFCGQHMDSNDDLQGTTAIARSLCSQLLQLDFPYDLDGTIGPDLELGLRDRSYWHICHLLGGLLMQLPAMTLFCVIDQVHLCQIGQDEDQLTYLVGVFRELMESIRLRVTIKLVLVASAFRDVGTGPRINSFLLPSTREVGDGTGLSFLTDSMMSFPDEVQG
ncbi:hypothetical protein F4780DRAFT_764334, partial [Xylariomycetidae sp. FL0641]